MKSVKPRYLIYAAAAAVLLMVQVMTLSSTTVAQEERPVLRHGVDAGDLNTLDPHFASGTQDRTVVDMIFNGLVRFSPGDASVIEADLAVEVPEPEMDGDLQTWTFTLRDDVMCHPFEGGEAYPLTSADVVFSLEKAANADSSGFSADYDGLSFEAVDDQTVVITSETALSPTLFLPKVANYAGGFIVCQQAVEALGLDGFATNPVGTGPFVFESYEPQTSVVLSANDDYFRGAPQLGGVEIRYMPDVTSRELALQSGELDVADGLNEAQWVEQIEAAGDLHVDVFGPGEVAFIALNVENEFLSDPLVRQAIALAVDPGEHQALYGSPVAEVVDTVVPVQLMVGGLTADQLEERGAFYGYDPEAAAELMAEAGYEDGFSLNLVTSEMPAYSQQYEVLQAELAQIGIDLNLEVVDHATMHSQIREDVNAIVVYVAFRPNADVYFTQFFHSDAIVVTGSNPVTNFSHYAEVDDQIEAARAETDAEAQQAMWEDISAQINLDVAAIPLMYTNQVYARTDAVDYGHDLVSVLALYPGYDETTTISS